MKFPEKLNVWYDSRDGKAPRTYRILEVDKFACVIEAIDVFGRRAVPKPWPFALIEAAIQANTWSFVYNEPLKWLNQPIEELVGEDKSAQAAAISVRDDRHDIVQRIIAEMGEFLYDSRRRKRYIRKLAKELDPPLSADTLESYLCRLWQAGMNANALLDRNFLKGGRGRKRLRLTELSSKALGARKKRHERYLKARQGKARERRQSYTLLPDDITQIWDYVIEYIFKTHGISWREGYRQWRGLYHTILEVDEKGTAEKKCKPLGTFPSYDQFYNHGQRALPEEEKKKRLLGNLRYQQRARPTGGVANLRASQAGYVYELDSTTADVVLLDRTRTTAIGRPTLYLLVDTWCDMIAGYSVSVENASYLMAALALENAMTDKVIVGAKMNVVIEEKEYLLALPLLGNENATLSAISAVKVADGWRAKLFGLWSDQSIAIAEICRRLARLRRAVLRTASEAGLPKRADCGALYRPKVSFESKRDRYRAQILSLMENNPQIARTEIRRLASSGWEFLRSWDLDWLHSHLPEPHARRNGVSWRTKTISFWLKRDADAKERLETVIVKIRLVHPPIRLTHVSMRLGLGIKDKSLKKFVKRYPITHAKMVAATESYADFNTRKISSVVELRSRSESGPALRDAI